MAEHEPSAKLGYLTRNNPKTKEFLHAEISHLLKQRFSIIIILKSTA